MSPSASEKQLFVDDVVVALTGAVEAGAQANLRERMRRAASEFDGRTAEAFARALLGEICREPDDLRRMEALIILGLAHPNVLLKHGISLDNEGHRLAVLLESKGELARARTLLETLAEFVPEQHSESQTVTEKQGGALRQGGTRDEQIERWLRRAEECAARGRTRDAITALQEILLLDRNRRDVARMIRDLRFQAKDSQRRGRRRWTFVGALTGAAALVALFVVREQHIAALFASLPPAMPGDLPAQQARLGAIDALVHQQHLWLGMLPVLREQTELESEIGILQVKVGHTEHEAAQGLREREAQAEDARQRGMLLAQQGRFDKALVDLKQALEFASPTWEHRSRVQADVDAIESWKAKQH